MHGAKKTYDGKIAGLYDLEETLGRGHFAVVKLARHVFTGEKVAVKVIDKTKLDEVSRAHLFQEVRCMKLVQHPNVVRLYEVIDTQTKLYLILELGDGGDLYDYIMKHETGLGEDMAKEYFRQIVRAISYCHQLHVVHRDLKPENVVFFERLGVVKLTDFGFSNKFCPGQKLDTSCGSLAYSAPEILLGDSYDAPAVDVWSLGVILYMLVAGQAPFQEANDSETLTMIMDCKYTIPTHVSDSCKRLIAKMLVREPESRATLEDIASDPWLGGPPQVEYLPLVSRHQVTEDDHNIIINKMVNGNIATKEEVLEALDRNEYNHITATYFLLAERKLRTYRQEQAESSVKQSQPFASMSASAKMTLGKAHSADSASSDSLQQVPPLGFTLAVPRTTGETTQGKVRKCSIVQEEEDEEEYAVVGTGQDLAPPLSSLNRRGSRSEGKLNLVVQERLAEERRKEKKDSPGASPHTSNVSRPAAKDDVNWPSKRMSPTSLRSGIPAPYIPSSVTRRGFTNKATCADARVEGSFKIETQNAWGDSVRTNESGNKSAEKTLQEGDNKVINSSQMKAMSASPQINVIQEGLEFSEVSLKDSATITIPIHPVPVGSVAGLGPKYKTMPSPTRSGPFEGIPEMSVATSAGDRDAPGSGIHRKGITTTSITYEQRRSKFHKARTASCSSSDASDDDSESRKKRAHKMSMEKNAGRRRDSHDDSNDSRDGGGNGGAGANPASSGLGSGGDGVHNQGESGSGQGGGTAGGDDRSGSGSHQRQCNGDNFRRNRRRTGETRLRESQSLNRIMEVQESESGNGYSGVFRERFGKRNECDVGGECPGRDGPGSATGQEKSKAGKSLGARFLQSWSNTISSTKLSVHKKKAERRTGRPGWELRSTQTVQQIPAKNECEEKENKALIEKTGKKVKVLGRYFQVSKKLCIPIPGLSTRGRLYKARSCGSISKDKISLPAVVTSGSATLKPGLNGVVRRGGGGGDPGRRPNSPGLIPTGNGHAKSPSRSWKSIHKGQVGVKGTPDGSDKGSDVNENVSTAVGAYSCPNVGICHMHMRDAAKCHLS